MASKAACKAECIELHAGTITFKISGIYASQGDTITIEFGSDRYQLHVNSKKEGEVFEASFPEANQDRTRATKLLRKAAGDKAYEHYE